MDEKNEKIFNSEEIFSTELRDRLETLAAGLIYISETDAPITAFAIRSGAATVEQTLRGFIGADPQGRFTSSDPADLISRLTAIRDWYGEPEKERAARFSEIFSAITNGLTDVRLYRSGTTRVEVIVAGSDANGDLVGIRTQAVET